MDGSRFGSRQMVQGSDVSTLPQDEHTTMRSLAMRMASLNGLSSVSRFLMRWSAARRAERGPKPGRRASSWIRRSISGPATCWAIKSSEHLQAGRKRQTLGELRHALLRDAVDLAPGVVHGRHDQVFENFLLVRVHERGIDVDRLHLALA